MLCVLLGVLASRVLPSMSRSIDVPNIGIRITTFAVRCRVSHSVETTVYQNQWLAPRSLLW